LTRRPQLTVPLRRAPQRRSRRGTRLRAQRSHYPLAAALARRGRLRRPEAEKPL